MGPWRLLVMVPRPGEAPLEAEHHASSVADSIKDGVGVRVAMQGGNALYSHSQFNLPTREDAEAASIIARGVLQELGYEVIVVRPDTNVEQEKQRAPRPALVSMSYGSL